jgi:hypothetical protein
MEARARPWLVGEVVVAGATLSLDAIYDRTDSLPGT